MISKMRHSFYMQQVCAELIQRRQDEKQRRKMFSTEERVQFKEYRNGFNERIISRQLQDRVEREEKTIQRRKVIRDALADWAECAILVWDTKKAPSNIFEFEAAAELPYSQKNGYIKLN